MPVFFLQLAAPLMTEGGRVIFFSSSLTSASGVMPGYALYNSTKGAIEQFSRVFSKDLAKKGITV